MHSNSNCKFNQFLIENYFILCLMCTYLSSCSPKSANVSQDEHKRLALLNPRAAQSSALNSDLTAKNSPLKRKIELKHMHRDITMKNNLICAFKDLHKNKENSLKPSYVSFWLVLFTFLVSSSRSRLVGSTFHFH